METGQGRVGVFKRGEGVPGRVVCQYKFVAVRRYNVPVLSSVLVCYKREAMFEVNAASLQARAVAHQVCAGAEATMHVGLLTVEGGQARWVVSGI